MKKILSLLIILVGIYSCKRENRNLESEIIGNKKAYKIDSLLTLLNSQEQFNGNVLIREKDTVILKKSYGLANRKTKENLNENSVFELASLSKQFTATGIILLAREKKISYEDKVTDYFPELSFCNDVTIKNLLNHSSGIPEYFGLMMKNGDKSKTATNKDVIKVLSKNVDSLNFVVNDKFQYSNTNYLLLASIIEKVTKMNYADFMEKNIFEPLNLKNTFIYNRRYKPQNIENYAYGYVLGDKQNITLPDSLSYLNYVTFLDGIVGDGMVNSTINDLKKWDESITKYKLINPKEFEYLKKMDTLNNGEINTYSFGWRFNDSIMSHSGSWPGYVNYISRNLISNDLIVILQNYDEIVLPVKPIKEILENKSISVSYKKEIQLDSSILKEYEGEYYDSEDSTSITKLTVGNNALIFNSTNNPWDMPFYPDSKNTFFSKAPRMNIGFEFVEENGITKLFFLQNNKQIGKSIKK